MSIICLGNCLQLLGCWNFFVFFQFFPLKLVYFWTNRRKKNSTHFVPLIWILAPKIMEEWNNHFKNSDFCKLLRLCAISALQISKKHFATFDFFVKMKLVLTVWVSTSLSKFGYCDTLCIAFLYGHWNTLDEVKGRQSFTGSVLYLNWSDFG